MRSAHRPAQRPFSSHITVRSSALCSRLFGALPELQRHAKARAHCPKSVALRLSLLSRIGNAMIHCCSEAAVDLHYDVIAGQAVLGLCAGSRTETAYLAQCRFQQAPALLQVQRRKTPEPFCKQARNPKLKPCKTYGLSP